MNSKYLIDSNSFIGSSQRFYNFSCFPGYWQWLETNISKNNSDIVLPFCVYDELLKNNDYLSRWIKNMKNYIFDERNEPEVLQNYAKVLSYITESKIYGSNAIRNWSTLGKADPFLIAIAMTYDYKIVTFEQESGQFHSFIDSNGNLTNAPRQKDYFTDKEPKIPDVANHFGVICTDIYEVEQNLQLKL